MRTYILLTVVLRYFNVKFGFCMYMVGTLGFQSPVVAFVVYSCLLRDCQYWLGILKWEANYWSQSQDSESGFDVEPARGGLDTLRRPLLGTSLAPHSARMIAEKMDSRVGHIDAGTGADAIGIARSSRRKGVKILNFAFLRIDQPVASTAAEAGALAPQQVVLGSGSSCRVFQGTFRDRPVAIKMIFCPDLTPDTVVGFYHEATLLAQLQHENVVEVLGVCVLPPSICLVMELCDGGNLFDFLRAPAQVRAPLTLWRQLSLSWDCCSAVQFLHTHVPAVLHLDLKSLNFLLTRAGRVKVADLELSREIVISPTRTGAASGPGVVSGSELSGFKVPETLYWLAPEIILGRPYNEKADIYALALVVWEVFTAGVPYRALEDSLVLAARNAKYLEALGFATGTYPLPIDAMPYSLQNGVNSRVGRHGASLDGSIDEALLAGVSAAASRRDSSSSAGVHTGRQRADSGHSNQSSGRQTPQNVIVGSFRRNRRSFSSNGHRHPDGEEEEMSTPSSASSSKSHSEAPSPSINPPTPRNGYFLGGASVSTPVHHPPLGASPPIISDLPASSSTPNLTATITTATATPVTTISVLTAENLAGHADATATSALPAYPSYDAYPSLLPSPPILTSAAATATAAVDLDPILVEWKRMHHHLHSHPVSVGSTGASLVVNGTSSSTFLPDFGAGIAAPTAKRPTYTRPTLPPIPASVASTSFLGESVQSASASDQDLLLPAANAHGSDALDHDHEQDDLSAVEDCPSDAEALSASASMRSYSALDQSQSASLAGTRVGSFVTSASDGAARGGAFAGTLSPVLASVESTPMNEPTAIDEHASAMPHTALGQPALPLPATQYDDHQSSLPSTGSLSFDPALQQQALWSTAVLDEGAFDLVPSSSTPTLYPSSMPAPSAYALPPHALSASSRASSHSNLLAHNTNSGLSSPALSATGSERVPRVSRLALDDARAKSSHGTSSRSGGGSRKKRAEDGSSSASGSSRSKKSRPRPPDFASIFVSRHDVQSQLRHLICVEHYRPTIPPDMPDELASLLTRAWHPVPNMRPDASEFVAVIAGLVEQLRGQTTRRHTEEDADESSTRGRDYTV